MYRSYFSDDFGSLYGDRGSGYERKLKNLTELIPAAQDIAIEAARKIVASRHKDTRYFVADSQDMTGEISAALVMYNKDRHKSAATYRMALIFRDGRMALTTATHKRAKGDYEKENIDEVAVKARCKRLLEEALGVHSEKKFELSFDSDMLKFPETPNPYHTDPYSNWYLPGDLKSVTYIEGTPFRETDGAYEQNFRQSWDTEIHGAGANDARLKKGPEEAGQFTMSKSFSDIKAIVRDHEEDRFNTAWSFFEDRLNPAVLKACKEVGIISAKAYNWLAGDGNSYRSARRIQAAQTYSLFFRSFGDREVTAAIDGGEPLKPVLAKKAGANHGVEGLSKELRSSTVQRLQAQFSPQDIMSLPHDHVWRENWSRLDALPPEWWPKTREDIEAYTKLVEVAGKYEEICGMPRMQILQEFKGQWQAACKKLQDGRSMHTDDQPQYYYTPREVEDYLKTLHRKLYLPVMLQEADAQKVATEDFWFEKSPQVGGRGMISALFNDVSLVKRVELSRAWHRKIAEIDAAMAELSLAAGVGKDGGLSWPAVTAPQTAPNGVVIVPLTNDAELRQEGDTLHHCVGGYGAECYKGASAIISLRSGTGEHLSTLQLHLSKEHVYAAQHRAVNNAVPGAEAQAAAKWYISAINGNQIPTALPGIHAMQSKSDTQKAATKIVGFDPFDPAACRKSFDIYKPCLPKRYRDMDYDSWLKEMKLNVDMFLKDCKQRQKKAKAGPQNP